MDGGAAGRPQGHLLPSGAPAPNTPPCILTMLSAARWLPASVACQAEGHKGEAHMSRQMCGPEWLHMRRGSGGRQVHDKRQQVVRRRAACPQW